MIHFHVEMEGLTQIESDLGMMKDKSKMVLRAAINQTAKETIALLTDEAARQYYITSRAHVQKTLDRKNATTGNLVALVTSTGKTTELYNFRVSPKAYSPRNRPLSGHTGNVKRTNPAKDIYLRPGASGDKYKAFIVKFKNGHKSVAQRIPGSHAQGKWRKEAIKNLRATSIPTMLGNEKGVYGVVQPKMNDMLQRNIQEQIQRFIK